jgi:hypothetical protein
MKNELEEMRIRVAKNGGHTVTHEFERKATKREGTMNGGIYNERPPSEEHVFGPDDGAKLGAHLVKHLNLKGISTAGMEKPTDQE